MKSNEVATLRQVRWYCTNEGVVTKLDKLELSQTTYFRWNRAVEIVVVENNGCEEREITYVRGEVSDQALRRQVYRDDTITVSAAASDAFPATEMDCLVP